MLSLSLRRVAIILKREYLQRVVTRSFAASTLLIPGILIAMFLVPAYLTRGSAPPPQPAVREHAAMIGAVLAAAVLLYVLFVSLFSYGAIVMRAVLEEKQSRVLEILLCFASPDELMAGKVLGIGALALTQVAAWILIGGIIVVLSSNTRIALAAMHLGPAALIYFVVFDLLGYLLYSAMFCAIGAAFNSADEAQQWTVLLVVPLIATGMLLSTVLSRPDSPLSVVASIVPFTSPALMYARVILGHPPLWQIVLAIFAMFASIVIAIRICAGIYRVGILMYGKKPTAREITRWLRQAS